MHNLIWENFSIPFLKNSQNSEVHQTVLLKKVNKIIKKWREKTGNVGKV